MKIESERAKNVCGNVCVCEGSFPDTNRVVEVAGTVGLKVNVRKTEVMLIGAAGEITLEDVPLDVVDQFRYFGVKAET